MKSCTNCEKQYRLHFDANLNVTHFRGSVIFRTMRVLSTFKPLTFELAIRELNIETSDLDFEEIRTIVSKF